MKITYALSLGLTLAGVALIGVIAVRDGGRHSSTEVPGHNEAGRGKASERKGGQFRNTEDFLDNVTRAKFDKFLSLGSVGKPESEQMTEILSNIPLSPEKIDFLIGRMGRENVLNYLEGIEGGIHESVVSSIICNKFIESEIEGDYVRSIDSIRRIGASALQGENFSRLIARVIIEEDYESIDLISREIIDRGSWSLRVNAALLKEVLERHPSYEDSFSLIRKIDPSGSLLQNVALEYLGDSAVSININSDDGRFILSYLNDIDFPEKEVFIAEFTERNAGSLGGDAR